MQRFNHANWVLAGVLALLTGCVATTPAVPDHVLSYDGLTPVESTRMSRVWVREGFSLAGYRKVKLDSAAIQYRPMPGMAGAGNGRVHALSDVQKQHLAELITAEFQQALSRLKLPQVEQSGPDVLLVRGTMLDVVSRAGPDPANSEDYQLDSIGQLTFMVELIDSGSNAVLVRAIDTRSARTPGEPEPATAMDSGVHLVLSRWAAMLVDALNDLTAIDTLPGA